MTTKLPLVLDFDQIRSKDLPLVGGKGANLGEMTYAGFPVPPGFCITTLAYDNFIATSDQSTRIFDILSDLSVDNLDKIREAGKEVRDLLNMASFREELQSPLLEAWRRLGSEQVYAIRSSATAEDLPNASFAGQQDTYLNVIGQEQFLESVKKCWISLFTDRAILYRIKNNFPHDKVKLSVVVQKMIKSERSGIMFTANPVTGHRHTILINASYGLGEALVSGLVNPDTYEFDKRKTQIVDVKISDKKIGIYPLKDGGTKEVELSEELRNKQVLSDEEILQLGLLGVKIEEYYKSPQDIEWASESQNLYIVQSRPITSLYPIDGLKYPEGTLGIFFSFGHQQNMLRAMTPMSLSSITTFLPVGHTESKYESDYVRISGDRAFLDITTMLRHRILKKIVLRVTGQMDALAPKSIQILMKRPEFKKSPRAKIPISTAFRGIKLILRVVNDIFRKNLSGFVDKTNRDIDIFLDEVREEMKGLQPDINLLNLCEQYLQKTPSFMLNFVPEAFAGIASTKILEGYSRKWLDDATAGNISLGIRGNVVNEMNYAIGDLADLLRESPELSRSIETLNNDPFDWLNSLESIQGGHEFLNAWQEFIESYGARGPSELDIYKPRWWEDPLPVLNVIREYMKKEKGSHRKQEAEFIQLREQAFDELLLKASKGIRGRFRRRRYRRLYFVMTEVGGMREHHKFMMIRLISLVKKSLLRIGNSLVESGKLKEIDDLWFLKWGELVQVLEGSTIDRNEEIKQRKIDYNRYQSLIPPAIISSDGESPEVNYEIADAPEGALLGNPVSGGVIEGIAHVIRDPTTESLKMDEVLVAEFTDPGWTPLFINAKGLILEIGGALTHGAVVAREYGIPAVVGVKNATSLIKTGQKVRVDGNTGIVEILE